jgi:hypothetical protein
MMVTDVPFYRLDLPISFPVRLSFIGSCPSDIEFRVDLDGLKG